MTTEEFLNELWGYKADEHYLLIWTVAAGEKKSRWFKDLGQASRYAERRSAEADVYFGVSLSGEPYQDYQRLKKGEREPVALYGMWADIDLAGDGHAETEKKYPERLEDVLRILADVSLEPTLLVHSGNGIHAHYCFKEPWVLETPEEVNRARILAHQWARTVQARAKVRGWDIDSIPDLERVLRVPGTFNRKDPSNIKPVKVLDAPTL